MAARAGALASFPRLRRFGPAYLLPETSVGPPWLGCWRRARRSLHFCVFRLGAPPLACATRADSFPAPRSTSWAVACGCWNLASSWLQWETDVPSLRPSMRTHHCCFCLPMSTALRCTSWPWACRACWPQHLFVLQRCNVLADQPCVHWRCSNQPAAQSTRADSCRQCRWGVVGGRHSRIQLMLPSR